MCMPALRKLNVHRRRPEDNELRSRTQHHESTPDADRRSRAFGNLFKWLAKLDSAWARKPLRHIGTVRLELAPEMVVNSSVPALHQLRDLRVGSLHRAFYRLRVKTFQYPRAFDDRPILVTALIPGPRYRRNPCCGSLFHARTVGSLECFVEGQQVVLVGLA